MAQPTRYSRSYSFTGHQAANPSDPIPAQRVDAEFDAVKVTTDETIANLALIQRDDGKLRNASVHPDAFDGASLLLMGSKTWTPRGEWATATIYAIGDMVEHGDATFVAVVAHLSSDFAMDRAVKRWLPIREGADSIAAAKTPVRVATTGNIALSGLQSIDGVVVSSGDRVLVKDQNSAADNGIYEASASGWARTSDFDEDGDVVSGVTVRVTAGTVNGSQTFALTTADPIQVGVSAQTWASLNDVVATGTTASRSLADRFASSISPRDFSAPTDGTDANAEIQAAMNAAASAGVPCVIDQNYTVDPLAGLDVPSNSTLIFQGAGCLTASATGKGVYEILRLFNVSNVNLIRPKIVGDRDIHLKAAPQAFTATDVSTADDTLTLEGHGFETGDMVRVETTGTAMTVDGEVWPYYRTRHAIRVDDDTLKFASSYANALAGIALDISAAGAGSSTIAAGGEWGHGIALGGTTDVSIIEPDISNCWGDGIYVGRRVSDKSGNPVYTNSTLTYCLRTRIVRANLYNNRRNNLSIITVVDCLVDSGSFRNANGTLPESGIDVEPNSSPVERLRGVVLRNIHTADNVVAGLFLALRNPTGEAIDVRVESMMSEDDGTGISAAVDGTATGRITLADPVVRRAKTSGLNLEKLDAASCDARILRPTITDCNQANDAAARTGSALTIWRSTSLIDHPLGNVDIIEPYIDSPLSRYAIYGADVSPGAPDSNPVNLINPRKLTAGVDGVMNITTKGRVEDRNGVLVRSFEAAETTAQTFSYATYARVVEGHATKGTVLTLPALSSVKHRPGIRVVSRSSGFSTRIVPNASDRIFPHTRSNGKYIQTIEDGAWVDLEPRADGWYVVGQSGAWQAEGLRTSITYDPGEIAAGAGETTSAFTLADAEMGDVVRATFSEDLAGMQLTAWVSAAGTCLARFQNVTAAPIDLASGTLRLTIDGRPQP